MHWDEQHAAASRLEEHLASLPYDRALPDLTTILADAGVPLTLLQQDERARKVLHEAILARPLSARETVEQRRVEVELLTLEVSVLTAALENASADSAAADRALRRLTAIRDRLEELREGLWGPPVRAVTRRRPGRGRATARTPCAAPRRAARPGRCAVRGAGHRARPRGPTGVPRG